MAPIFLSGIKRCVLFIKVLDLDYALCKDKPVAPTANTGNYDEQISKYNSYLEKREKSNKFEKMIIKQSISV